jgi:hypothetical protein
MVEPRPIGNEACTSEPFKNLMLRRLEIIFSNQKDKEMNEEYASML